MSLETSDVWMVQDYEPLYGKMGMHLDHYLEMERTGGVKTFLALLQMYNICNKEVRLVHRCIGKLV